MKLTYRPDGQEEQSWEFQLGKLRTAETEAIERRTKLAYDTEFREALMKGSILARRALLWTFQRRTHLALRFEDVDFAADEVKVVMDHDEWAAIRVEVQRSPAIPDEDRVVTLAVIDQQIAGLAEDGEPGEGKAPERNDEPSTP